MAYQNKNCNITSNDRMVSCSLCLENYHLKLSALKARDGNVLLDPIKSRHRCKSIKIEFYKFFKSYKTELDKLSKEFLNVQKRLLEFGDLFDNFWALEQ